MSRIKEAAEALHWAIEWEDRNPGNHITPYKDLPQGERKFWEHLATVVLETAAGYDDWIRHGQEESYAVDLCAPSDHDDLPL